MTLPLPVRRPPAPTRPRPTLERVAPPAPAPAASPGRLPSVDLLRGAVMVLMVLDHVRDYFTAVRFDPLDLTQTTTALFLTRWVTHFCAPVFVLLAGTSAWLAGRRRTRGELARFLATRGLWLVALEVTVVNLGWYFSLDLRHGLILQVIWAIGAAMVALAGLVFLPRAAIAAVAVALVAGHNLLDGAAPGFLPPDAWRLLHEPGMLASANVLVVYPLLPWIGVMALGYVLGEVVERPPAARRRTLLALGAGATAAFVALRLANGYGDPRPWTAEHGRAVLSFLDATKYPPSLAYLCMTLGPGLVALALLERLRGPLAAVLLTFGRVPLFFYVAHIYLAHALAVLAMAVLGFGAATGMALFLDFPATWGFGLAGVYAAWLVVLALLVPACRWFGERKRAGRAWWWSYL